MAERRDGLCITRLCSPSAAFISTNTCIAYTNSTILRAVVRLPNRPFDLLLAIACLLHSSGLFLPGLNAIMGPTGGGKSR